MMDGNWDELLINIDWVLRNNGPWVLSGIALLFLVLDRKPDIQTKTFWVLVIALIPVIGSLVSLFVRPRLEKQN
jgi:ABC-type spermidine/putrescine transport system permease subunit II